MPLALLALQNLRDQVDLVIAALGCAEPVPLQDACPHPEELRVTGNFGDPVTCGVCGKEIPA